MKRDTLTTIQVNSPRDELITLNARFLGEGLFAKCYLAEDSKVYSFVSSNATREVDYSKMAVAEWADSDNPHIPEITKNGEYDTGADYGNIYSMPFYNNLNASYKVAWRQFKHIMKVWDSMFWEFRNSPYDKNYEFINRLREAGELPESIIDAFESIMNACANYGSEYGFDLGKVNFSVDNDGNLILRDVICNGDAAREINKRNAEKAEKRNRRLVYRLQ
jgi:hypothetical protein